jgi:hypothetical protein
MTEAVYKLYSNYHHRSLLNAPSDEFLNAFVLMAVSLQDGL